MNIRNLINNEFSRNIGLLTEAEQIRLLESRVAVAGAGGVGGIHLLTLARLGVGKFNIADLDVFEPVNISRQFGAFHSTTGRHKVEVMAEMIRDINPQAEINLFREGISAANVDRFLDGVDTYVDGIDFFQIDIRRLIFKTARSKGIYAVTAAPLGFGATLQAFAPKGMSFDDYFGITDDMEQLEKLAAFTAGLTPRPYHLNYLDRSKVSIKEEKGPAVSPACTLAASLVATEVVKILTGKKGPKAVPHYLQIDMLRRKLHKGYVWGGGKNPLMRILRHYILKEMRKTME
ncbi:ThiF family adenylyltransferase [Trichloromonas sp.]|uniref:ThiF family adenylyltransferase n=1 Tax=Trichloromonas sp. TaxID=3069249 RepID=UPI003D817C2F